MSDLAHTDRQPLTGEASAAGAAAVRAAHVRAARRRRARRGAGEQWPLSYAQERLWFLDQLSAREWCLQCSDALQLVGALERTALVRSLNEIVRRHEALRTTFVPDQELACSGHRTRPGTRRPCDRPGEAAGNGAGAEADRLLDEEVRDPRPSQRPFVARPTAAAAGPGARLLLTMHHVVSDSNTQGPRGVL